MLLFLIEKHWAEKQSVVVVLTWRLVHSREDGLRTSLA
jgi:hypothetical protein